MSRTLERKLVTPRFIRQRMKGTILGEQSTDKGKSSNEASLDSETHGTIVSSGTVPSRRGGRRSTAEIRGSDRGV